MNTVQQMWWRQACSDLEIWRLLRTQRVAACHQPHYLQMVAEKIAKAYFWRSGLALPKSHAGLVQFMRRLSAANLAERATIAAAFTFHRHSDMQQWINANLPLAYQLERLAPALALGPNPEYLWPSDAPQHAPATHQFAIWNEMTQTGRGRLFLRLIEMAVDRFPDYA